MRAHTSSYPAVVLAGGQAPPEIVAMTGVNSRALIPIDGRPMLSYVVHALREAGCIDGVTVVGNVPDSPDYARIADQGSFVENFYAGLDVADKAEYLLVATADIPFLTAAAVEDFVLRGAETRADLLYPIVAVERCYARFPGVKRTAIRLRDGRWTGGNMILARPAFLRQQRGRLLEGYSARKSPLRLAQMLGVCTALRLVLSQIAWPDLLDVAQLEASVSRLLGGKVQAIVSNFPELATDIDRPSDLAAVLG
jgi:GTP:adenosylcobinamide-phosphate guanylyltransferase